MIRLLKNIISFILPITVVIVVPLLLEDRWRYVGGIQGMGGLFMLGVGILLLVVTVASFITKGKGTLAPWAPTQKLVVTGPYRYTRNPMISGVFFILLGEFLSVGSPKLFIWATCFLVINTVYFIFSEEPGLEKRFGEQYVIYRKNVPMWIPRLTPFSFPS